jgi:predicted 3-demethylubiquinone-9 3-methyltransferase (glyoxalase superfamily)
MAITGVTTFLWFDNEAVEAAEFYVSLFPDSLIKSISHYQKNAQKPVDTVLTVEFQLFGQSFAALNAGPQFPHTEAVSFQISCDTQDEVDHIWNSLTSNGGQESMCGWCKDRFGISWQVIPKILGQLLSSSDREKSGRAFAAMMQMRKIDIAGLQRAVD